MAIKIAKQPYTEIELVVDECQHEFGVPPCTASGEPCYKTRATCEDTANYARQDRSYIFCSSVPNFPKGQNIIPCIEKVDDVPASITGGLGLGKRAKISATIKDFKHHDRGIDPYFDQRSYDTSRGSFFGKWLARNPYYQGRTVKVRYGDLPVPYDVSKLTELHLIIEKITHPGGDDMLTMTFRDILKKVDAKRAKYPLQSSGELAVACGVGDATITLKTGQGADYIVNEHVTLGDETMLVTAINGDVLDVTRAQWGSNAVAHSVDAKVQICKTYTNVNIVDILKDLYVNGANINPAFIPDSEWESEKTEWVPDHNLTALIPKPEPVDKLSNELMMLGLLDVWPDLEANQIKLKASSPFRGSAQVISEQDIVEQSLKIGDKPELRLSRVWVRFGAENPLKKQDDDTNYKRGYALGDPAKEAPEQYDEIRADVISSRWLRDTAQDRDHAFSLTNRLLSRYKDNPKEFEFELWMDRPDLPKTGDVVKVQFSKYQDKTGAPILKTSQILETAYKRKEGKVKYRALAYDSAINGGDGDNSICITSDQFNYNLWLAVGSPPDPITIDVCVEEGVSICSLDAGSPSFSIGNFAEGSVINAMVKPNAKIGGAGGKGGDGGGRLVRNNWAAGEIQSTEVIFDQPAEPGQLGGHAIQGAKGVTLNLDNQGIVSPGYHGTDGVFHYQQYDCYTDEFGTTCDPTPPVYGHAGDGGDGCLPGEGGAGYQFGDDGADGAQDEINYRDMTVAGAAVYNPNGFVNVVTEGTLLGEIVRIPPTNAVWQSSTQTEGNVIVVSGNNEEVIEQTGGGSGWEAITTYAQHRKLLSGSGVFQIEFEIQALESPGSIVVGLIDDLPEIPLQSPFALGNDAGLSPISTIGYWNNGDIEAWVNGFGDFSVNQLPYAAGQYIQIVVNLDLETIQFFNDGVLQYEYDYSVSSLVGALRPACTMRRLSKRVVGNIDGPFQYPITGAIPWNNNN